MMLDSRLGSLLIICMHRGGINSPVWTQVMEVLTRVSTAAALIARVGARGGC